MAQLSYFKRLIMKVMTWAMDDLDNTRTHPINPLLFGRVLQGKLMAAPDSPQIVIGSYTYGLRPDSFFPYHPEDKVIIGKFCSIADGVRFVFGEHPTNLVSTFPFRAICFDDVPHADAVSKGQIKVGNDVWLGARALILSGVEIGDGAVVGAGSIVTKHVPPYAIVAGAPARIIRYRFSPEQIQALRSICWWDWPLAKIEENLDLFYSDVDAFLEGHVRSTSKNSDQTTRSQ